MTQLRATHDRLLLVRLHDRGPLINHVHEVMGITDRVLQFGEVVGLGSEWVDGKYRAYELKKGDVVIYPSPRVHDHFVHYFDETHGALKGTRKVLVVPGKWVGAIVRGTFLADHPEAREYGAPLE